MKKIIHIIIVGILLVLLLVFLTGCKNEDEIEVYNEIEVKDIDVDVLNNLKIISEKYIQKMIQSSKNIGIKDEIIYEYSDSSVQNDTNVLNYKLSNYNDVIIRLIFDSNDNIVKYAIDYSDSKEFVDIYPYISTAMLISIDENIFDKESSGNITLNLIDPMNLIDVGGGILESEYKQENYRIKLIKIPQIVTSFEIDFLK